jgi:hypothetical protein
MAARERGPLLTVWLVLMLFSNAVTILIYSVLNGSPVGRALLLPFVPAWMIPIFIFMGVLNLVCVCFLFLWKKWAFFALCSSAAIALIINLDIGVGAFSFVGLAGAVMTYLILRPKWNLLDNY